MNLLIQNKSSFFIAFNRPANYPHKLSWGLVDLFRTQDVIIGGRGGGAVRSSGLTRSLA